MHEDIPIGLQSRIIIQVKHRLMSPYHGFSATHRNAENRHLNHSALDARCTSVEDRYFQSQLRLAEEEIGCSGVRPNLKPEHAAFLDRYTPDLEYIMNRFGIDYLTSEDVMAPGRSAEPAAKTVEDVIEFDDGLLSELRKAVVAKCDLDLF